MTDKHCYISIITPFLNSFFSFDKDHGRCWPFLELVLFETGLCLPASLEVSTNVDEEVDAELEDLEAHDDGHAEVEA